MPTGPALRLRYVDASYHVGFAQMSYRDEQEAAIARADALQLELDRAKRERDEATRAKDELSDKLGDAVQRAEQAEALARKLESNEKAGNKAGKEPRRAAPTRAPIPTHQKYFVIAAVVGTLAVSYLGYVTMHAKSPLPSEPSTKARSVAGASQAMAEAKYPMDTVPVPLGRGVSVAGDTLSVPYGDDDPRRGSSDAKVTIVEWIAFDCSFCRKAAATIERVLDAYGDDLAVVYKMWILTPSYSTAPALATCAANRQEAFARMDKRIWAHDVAANGASEQQMLDIARALDLDPERFEADMRGACVEVVAANQRQLASFGIGSVPAMFVNGRYVGNMPYDALAKIIDEELAVANKRIAAGTPLADYYQTWVVDYGSQP